MVAFISTRATTPCGGFLRSLRDEIIICFPTSSQGLVWAEKNWMSRRRVEGESVSTDRGLVAVAVPRRGRVDQGDVATATLRYLITWSLGGRVVLIMSRRRGNLFAGSYNEELHEALAANPNFVQAPSLRSSYLGTRAEDAAAASVPDASDPPYTPTARRGDPEAIPAARSPRRSKRLRPFYVDREVEPVSANRRTRETQELLTTRETVRERLLLIQISSSSSSSDSEGSSRSPLLVSPGLSTRSNSSEFADDNFPHTNASADIISEPPHPPQSAVNCASVSIATTPRAHRRKQNRPYRCPVM